jgi:hypothetical protein
MAGVMSSHDVRNVRVCEHCNSPGSGLLQSGFSGQPYDSTYNAAGTPIKHYFHPQCFVEKFGFRKVTKLPADERSKFRICDISSRQMRRLLELGDTADVVPSQRATEVKRG